MITVRGTTSYHHMLSCYFRSCYYQINMICDVWRLFLWRCSMSDVAIELWFPGSKHAREKKNIYIYLLTALFKPTAYWLISLCQRNVFLYATLHHLTFVFNWLLTENNSWKLKPISPQKYVNLHSSNSKNEVKITL